VGTLLFLATLAAGIWLRVQVWPPGPSSDETSILQPLSEFGARGIVDSPEAATNPPLFRFLFSLLDEPVRMYRWGRISGGVCGILAPILVFFAARRAARQDSVAGAIAGAVVALNPTLAVESLSFRVYGLLALVAAARMLSLCMCVEDPELDSSRPAWILFMVLTIALPWLHYSSIPLLGLEAVAFAVLLPHHRRLLLAHAASAVLAIPTVLLLLKWRAILPPPPPSGTLIANAMPLWFAGYSGPGALALLAGFTLILLGLYRDAAPGRAVLGHALAWVGASMAVASYRAIRAGSLSITLIALGLTLGLLGASLPRPWRYACHTCVAIAFASWLSPSLRSDLLPIGYPSSGTAAAIAFAADLEKEPRPVRVHVFPTWNMGVLQYQLIAAGETRGWMQCGDVTPSTCSPSGTFQFFGVEKLENPPPGRLVVLDCDRAPVGCQERGGYPCAKVYDCP
jgi:hypothetical protein